MLAVIGNATAIAEDDWGATTVFGLFGAPLLVVGVRNGRGAHN